MRAVSAIDFDRQCGELAARCCANAVFLDVTFTMVEISLCHFTRTVFWLLFIYQCDEVSAFPTLQRYLLRRLASLKFSIVGGPVRAREMSLAQLQFDATTERRISYLEPSRRSWVEVGLQNINRDKHRQRKRHCGG